MQTTDKMNSYEEYLSPQWIPKAVPGDLVSLFNPLPFQHNKRKYENFTDIDQKE